MRRQHRTEYGGAHPTARRTARRERGAPALGYPSFRPFSTPISVERELARARTRGRTPARAADAAPIAEVVEALFGILRRTEKGGSIEFVNNAPRAARAPIERSDLVEVLGNVLDNAVLYARTMVRVSCKASRNRLQSSSKTTGREARGSISFARRSEGQSRRARLRNP